jgi:hypothetical protein
VQRRGAERSGREMLTYECGWGPDGAELAGTSTTSKAHFRRAGSKSGS